LKSDETDKFFQACRSFYSETTSTHSTVAVVSGRDWRLLRGGRHTSTVAMVSGRDWRLLGGTLEHSRMEAEESGEAHTAQ
jgi:hypothetical protein